jgi:pheromone shutdown protein TraB
VERVGDRLVIIGTVHVDPSNASMVRETIVGLKPEVVALELDAARMMALENPSAQRSRGAGLSFLTMALLEKYAGQLTGSAPGMEMLEAARAAQLAGSKIAFIDLPIANTAAALKKLPRKEKAKLVIDGLASLVILPFGGLNWSKVTEDVGSQIEAFRKRYPVLSRILIDSREEYMVNVLKRIMDQTTGQVVVVVGFGHRDSLVRALRGYVPGMTFASGFSGHLSTGWVTDHS